MNRYIPGLLLGCTGAWLAGCGGSTDAMFQLDNVDVSHNTGGRYAIYASDEGCSYGSWLGSSGSAATTKNP